MGALREHDVATLYIMLAAHFSSLASNRDKIITEQTAMDNFTLIMGSNEILH